MHKCSCVRRALVALGLARLAIWQSLALALALTVPALPAAAQMDFVHMSGAGKDIRRTVIAKGIYQFMTMRDSYVRQLNSIVVVNDKDVLVFDTDTRPSTARIILSRIRKITNKPVRFVVNSHGHPDHWSGNEVYAKAFPGLEIISTETTRQFMHRISPVWAPRFEGVLEGQRKAFEAEVRSGKQDDGTALTPAQRKQDEADLHDYATFVAEQKTLHRVYPTLTFGDALTFFHGGREFRFLNVTGDAEGTAALYLPKEKVLLTGDAVSYPIPYISNKPSLQAKSLRMLGQLDVDVIVPGHGPAFHDKKFLNLELEFIEAVLKGVADALKNGAKTREEVQQTVTVSSLQEKLAHGDPDLIARFKSRVRDLAGFAFDEQKVSILSKKD